MGLMKFFQFGLLVAQMLTQATCTQKIQLMGSEGLFVMISGL